MKSYTLFLLSFFLPFFSFAGVILGAEIRYKYLGSAQGLDSYEINVYVYRSCAAGSTGFNSTILTGIYKGDTLVATPSCDYISKTAISPLPSGLCVEVGLYKKTVFLPTHSTGYSLVFQNCCWGGGIQNIYQPNQVGFSVTATIPPVPNTSPEFGNFFPMYAVRYHNFNYDMSATDQDNDAIRYHLLPVFAGGTANNPTPNPPTAPPYTPLLFFNPYSYTNPIASTTPLQYDSLSGIMTASPNDLGNYVVGLGMKEYRNGNLLAEYHATFLMNLALSAPSAIDFLADLGVEIFPNPAKNILYVRDDAAIIQSISCFDIAGKCLFTTQEKEISIEYLEKGIYFLHLTTKKGSFMKKCIKE